MIRLLLLALVAGPLAYLVLRWRRDRREDALARARAAFFVRSSEPLAPRREPPPLREVTLTDGRLRFRVPAVWDDEPSPTGAYAARAPGSRRLSVDFDATREAGPGDAAGIADALERSEAGRQGVVQVLPGDRVLLKHVRTDRGPDAHLLYCWELWASRPGRGPLTAAFAFRVPAEALDAITEDDLRLLEREIRNARLA